MRRFAIVGSMVVASGCSGATTPEPPTTFECQLGELTGTWRLKYTETNGSCGRLPDETVVLGAQGPDSGTSDCTLAAGTISADKCRLDQDFTCPSGDGLNGKVRWVGVTKHVAKDRLESDMTISIREHPKISCQSTYTITWTRL